MKNKIAKLRKKHKLSQTDLAEKLQVTRQTISGLEREIYKPSIILAFKVSYCFGYSIEDVFDFSDIKVDRV